MNMQKLQYWYILPLTYSPRFPLKSYCCGLDPSLSLNLSLQLLVNKSSLLELIYFLFFWTSPPKKGNARECSNYRTVAIILHASKVMLKFLQARIQQYMNHELPDVQPGFRKESNKISNCQYLLDHQKSKRVPEKHLFLLYWLCQILWLCGSQYTVENSERDGNTRPPDLPLDKPVRRSGSNS